MSPTPFSAAAGWTQSGLLALHVVSHMGAASTVSSMTPQVTWALVPHTASSGVISLPKSVVMGVYCSLHMSWLPSGPCWAGLTGWFQPRARSDRTFSTMLHCWLRTADGRGTCLCVAAVLPRDKLSKEANMADGHKTTTINHFYEKLLKLKVSSPSYANTSSCYSHAAFK